MRKKILILTSYEGVFQSKATLKHATSMDVNLLRAEFEKNGYRVKVMKFEDVIYISDFSEYFVIYSSSEDEGLFYKSYIEDILLYVEMQGGILIPKFTYFRAHHNKVMMELIRKSFYPSDETTFDTQVISFPQAISKDTHYPVVVKASAGAGSKGVFLCHNAKELQCAAKKSGITPLPMNRVDILRRYLKRENGKIRIINDKKNPERGKFRKKLIIQKFIKNLQGDYKILVFGEKYYILYRKNRANDFRASGSGKFEFPQNGNDYSLLLDFAKECKDKFHVPICSLDIAFDGEKYYLIEFQFLNFGTLTLTESSMYYVKQASKWIYKEEKSILEKVYVEAIAEYIKKNEKI